MQWKNFLKRFTRGGWMQEQDQVDFKKATNCHIYEKALVKQISFLDSMPVYHRDKSKQKAIQADSALLPSKMCGDWRSTLLEDSMQMIPTTLRAIIRPMMSLLAVSNLLWPSTRKNVISMKNAWGQEIRLNLWIKQINE